MNYVKTFNAPWYFLHDQSRYTNLQDSFHAHAGLLLKTVAPIRAYAGAVAGEAQVAGLEVGVGDAEGGGGEGAGLLDVHASAIAGDLHLTLDDLVLRGQGVGVQSEGAVQTDRQDGGGQDRTARTLTAGAFALRSSVLAHGHQGAQALVEDGFETMSVHAELLEGLEGEPAANYPK